MFEHASEDDFDVLKKLIVAGIEEDLSSLQGLATLFAGSAARLATVDCGYPLTGLGSQDFKAVANLFGQKVGEKVMRDAFAKLGQ